MSKVKLMLTAVNEGVTKDEIKNGLSELYNKPESHFEPHCKHLFDLKKPFVLLKKVEFEEAERHRNKLDEIGIECDIELVSGADDLALMPMAEGSESGGVKCPACDQMSIDPKVCDQCGVSMEKFANQKRIDTELQKKISSAQRSHDRIEEAQKSENLRRKKSRKKKPEAQTKTPQEESQDLLEGQISKVSVVDKKSNRIMYLATAALLTAAVGGGYLAYMIKNSTHQDQYEFAAAKAASESSIGVQSAENLVVEIQPMVESTVFSNWRTRMAEIDELKFQMDTLNKNVGLSSTMAGLVESKDDSLVRTIGEHYAAKLALKSDESMDTDIDYRSNLHKSSVNLNQLPTGSDRLYAALDLGKTYHSLGFSEEASSAYAQARKYALETLNSDDASQRVISEVIAAEFLISKGQHARSKRHYSAALVAAEMIESGTADTDWAIAFVVKSEASVGRIADAYEHSEEISDTRIEDLVLAEVARFVDEIETDVDVESISSNEDNFADDPALMLLFENSTQFKENASKISELPEGYK